MCHWQNNELHIHATWLHKTLKKKKKKRNYLQFIVGINRIVSLISEPLAELAKLDGIQINDLIMLSV